MSPDRPDRSVVLSASELGRMWPTVDPFLFCVHHHDDYPNGNEELGPDVALDGRQIGQDFSGRDGFSMYHGTVVPGFPQHPHRGFETISIVRNGLMDHADSLGASARFGEGDVQWMTAGRGIVHSEMFPLLKRDEPNPAELFQIWINLPAANKMVEPHFTMLWGDESPHFDQVDVGGRRTHVRLVAGELAGRRAGSPPPKSWAAKPTSEVLICTLALDPEALFTLPPASPNVNRTLYFFAGDRLAVCGEELGQHAAIRVRPDAALRIENGKSGAQLLVLQGKPISEPVAHYGPFVMNTKEELQRAFSDYQRTQFGGWPWPIDAPVHPREKGRFAQHADGRVETKD